MIGDDDVRRDDVDGQTDGRDIFAMRCDLSIGSLGDARQPVSSGKYRPGAGLKTIGERGDDASDDASNWKNIRVM